MSVKSWLSSLVAPLSGVLLLVSGALAAGPVFMPGFPMRMGPNVMLMWNPVPGATGYDLFRSDKQGELGQKLQTLPMNNFMDSNVPMDKDVYYTVKAVGVEADASPQGVIAGVKPLDAPKWAGELLTEKEIHLRWDGVGGAAFYNLYRADSKDGPFSLAGSIQDNKYIDTKVEQGKTYYYQVSAVDKNNLESKRAETKEVNLKVVVAEAKAKVYSTVEKVVPFVGYWTGPDDREMKGATWLAIDPKAGRVYVCESVLIVAYDYQGNEVQKYDMPAGYKGEWGGPRGIAVAADGTLWTTWYPYNGVRHLAADGSVIAEWKVPRPTKEEYAAVGREKDYDEDTNFTPYPSGITVDAQGRVWVAEPVFAQVHIYDDTGKLLKKIGPPRPRGYALQDMRGLSVVSYHSENKRVYVLDPTVQTIRAFSTDTLDFVTDKDGKPIYGWKRAGATPGYNQLPKGFGFTRDGDVGVLDGIGNRIQVYDQDMEYKYTLTTKAGDPSPKELQAGITVVFGPDRFFVTETLNNRVAVFKNP